MGTFNDDKYNPYVMQMFMWKWQAELYAWKARRRGFETEIIREGNNWLLLGGRWSVRLDGNKRKIMETVKYI